MNDWPPLSTGLAGRCPRRGKGALFDGVLKVRDACPECRLDLRGNDAGDGTILPLRLIKGVLVAQQYHHRSTAGEDRLT